MIPLAMTLLFILLAFIVFWLALRGRELDKVSFDTLPGLLQPMDLAAFLNLIDPAQDEFLARELPKKSLAQVRKERLRAVLDYLGRARHNSAVLLRLGEAAQHAPDPELAASGRQLVEAALHFRMNAMLLSIKVYLGILTGGAPVSFAVLEQRYTALKSAFQSLSQKQAPANWPRLSESF